MKFVIHQHSDVKIHYVTAGEGPLLIMIHGFPDYWYTWRKQVPELARNFKVVAIDQRGYNESGQPDGVENYTLALLAQDIQNVIKHFGEDKANYPSIPADNSESPPAQEATAFPKIQCRVLMIHGLDDKALLPGALNDSWNFMAQDLTIVTLPDAVHFVQQDAADLVTSRISHWLNVEK